MGKVSRMGREAQINMHIWRMKELRELYGRMRMLQDAVGWVVNAVNELAKDHEMALREFMQELNMQGTGGYEDEDE